MALNLNVDMALKFDDSEKVSMVGEIRINKININGEGDGSIQLITTTSFVQMSVLNDMSKHGDEDIVIYFKYEFDTTETVEDDSEESKDEEAETETEDE